MQAREPYPRHFDGKRFFNPDAPQARGFLDVLRWMRSRRQEKEPRYRADVEPSAPPPQVTGAELRVTFVNHATTLTQLPGLNVLTDPMWSDRASPFSWAGPKRKRAPGVRWEDLPPIDLVLLSHNHYDHLDLPTLRRLTHRGNPQFVAPLGVGDWLRRKRIGPAHELDWGGSIALANASVHCVPAFHFSARGLFDRNRTLWCGYVLEAAGRRIYFAGDTAFGDHYGWIRDRFGPPDLALLPIGAYAPRWFMSAVHQGPEDAVKAHQILGAKQSVAIHFGTFQLADEGIDTPKFLLAKLEPGPSFVALKNGGALTLP